MSSEALLSCCVRIRDTGFQIHSTAVAFAGKWSKFRCSGEFSAYVLSRIMTALAQHICQFHLALRHSWWNWVLRPKYETLLTYSRQTRSFCCHLIEIQVHWKGSSRYPYDRLIAPYLPITVAIKLVQAILSTSVRISWSALQNVGYWDTAQVFMAKLHLSLPGVSWPLIEVLAQQ